jgi:oxalate decarboxylase
VASNYVGFLEDKIPFEEIDLAEWVQSSPRYLLSNNFAGVPETAITGLK